MTEVTPVTSDLCVELTTDKAFYKPNETVTFTAADALPAGTKVRYRLSGEIVGEEPVSGTNWTWKAPSTDFKGYMAELYRQENGTDVIVGTIAVDVSSHPARFPRYGFVADFDGDKTEEKTLEEMAYLNRHHINWVQFQDWHNKHHWPLGGTRTQLDEEYLDIANRPVHTSSVKNYIKAQQHFGMKSMFYNLCFGALKDAASDGVKEEWYLFKDASHTTKDSHDLPSGWKSNIYLVDPSDKEWQQYMAERNDDVYANFAFDGYQIDQLGKRGTLYNYNGTPVNLREGYASFIEAMKQMITQIGQVSQTLSEQAQSSKSVSTELNSATEIQSRSMGELNSTVDQLAVSVNEIAENATQLAGVAADTKKDSDVVDVKMRETVEVSEKGRQDMEKVSKALEGIELSIHNLQEAVDKVGTASGEIVDITNLIGSIAEETNLLSLNASIEAARAGEAGRGFAVVASEIGTLAKNSADSVANITELINEINKLVENAVFQAGSSAGEIADSAGLIHAAVDTFHTIFSNIQDTNELMKNVVSKIGEVDEVATNVAAICEEQAASSDEILATSESMLTQAKNITRNSEQVESASENLAVSANQLSSQIEQFRI